MKRIFYLTFMLLCSVIMFSFTASAATAGQVVTSGANLNLRKSPSTSAAVVKTVKNRSWLTLIEKKGSWYKVEYEKGKTAYASADYIRNYPKTVEGVVSLSSGSLNVRAGASMNHKIIDSLYNSHRILAVKSNSTWAGILYDGNKTGYVAKAYLKRISSVEAYPAVKLSVPSFKQTDSRWKNYPIGTTGGTIGTIGCLTTAIAMTESYYSGYSITPSQMAKKLSYSASGSLYWPSDYIRASASGDYLSEVYSLLKKGNPVIFGARKSSGGQHWVTVYGYEGGSGGLSADKFLIHDPGSNSRLTLQSFFSAYPVKDRFVYKK